MRTITINDGNAALRYRVGAPVWEGRDDYGTGVTLRAVYYQPHARRVIVETYSIWQRGQSGECVGTVHHIADVDEIASLRDRHDVPLPEDLIPLAEGEEASA